MACGLDLTRLDQLECDVGWGSGKTFVLFRVIFCVCKVCVHALSCRNSFYLLDTSLTNSPDHVASDHSAPRTLGIYVTILVVSTAPFLDLSCSELFSVCGRNSEDILCSGINFIIPRVVPQG